MKEKRLLAAVTALLLCVAIPFSALGDIKARNTEENGKITETAWEDDNGQPAPGPDGYCFVRYTYKQDDVFEKYYDADGQLMLTPGKEYAFTRTVLFRDVEAVAEPDEEQPVPPQTSTCAR